LKEEKRSKIFESIREHFPAVADFIEENYNTLKIALFTLLGIIVALLITYAVMQLLFPKKAKVQEDTMFQVKVQKVTRENFSEKYTVMGTIKGNTENDLRFEIDGPLASYGFKQGEPVKKNQIVASLDPKDSITKASYAQGRYNSERSVYFSAAQRLKVFEDLFKMKAVSETKLQEARYEEDSAREKMKSAQSELELAQSNLAKTNLTAPFDGIVSEILIQAGEFVTSRDIIAKFVSAGDVLLTVDIPEKDTQKLKIDMKVKVNCDSYPNQDFWGVISEIAPTVKEKSRTTEIKIKVPNNEGKLRSGMFGRGEVYLVEIPNSIVVPVETIVSLGKDTTMVPLVKPSKGKQNQGIIELRTVTIGQKTEKSAIVTEGLNADELLVIETQGQLSDGVPVIYNEVKTEKDILEQK